MRRNDRAITSFDDMVAVLSRCEVLRIGFSTRTVPYIVPVHFAYRVDGEHRLSLYFHGATAGRKLKCYEENPHVSFEADRLIETYGEETVPCTWTADYESIMGEGVLRRLDKPSEKTGALDLLMARYGFDGALEYPPQMLEKTAVFALDVLSLSGKAKRTKE